MKRNILPSFLALALLSLAGETAYGQDERQRTVPTIVQDALAQLPSKEADALAVEMRDIAKSAPESVKILADMLVPASEGQNNKVEYAINGVVNYAGSEEGRQYSAAVRKGLFEGLAACQDTPNQVFLLTQIRLLAEKEDVQELLKYVGKEELSSVVVNILIGLDGSDDALVELIRTDGASRPLLAYAAAERHISAAEPYILSWVKELGGDATEDSDLSSKADTPDMRSYYHALSCCGSKSSLKVLKKNSVYDYMTLLSRLAQLGDTKTAVSGAGKYLDAEDVHIRCAALEIVVAAKGPQSVKEIAEALGSPDKDYRSAALSFVTFKDDAGLQSALKDIFPGLDAGAKADVVSWIGAEKVSGLSGLVKDALDDSDIALAVSAVKAAGMLGGEDMADALIGKLSADKAVAAVAFEALLSMDEDIEAKIGAVIGRKDAASSYALEIASRRRMKSLSPEIFAIAGSSDDASLRQAACKALPGVVTVEDAAKVNTLLVKEQDAACRKYLQNALCRSLAGLAASEQYEKVNAMIQDGGRLDLYYPVLAQAGGSRQAVQLIKDGYDKGIDRDAAFGSLMKTKDWNAGEVLLSVAKADAQRKTRALGRYVDLVNMSSQKDIQKVQRYMDVMNMDPDLSVKKKVLSVLKNVRTMPAFLLASKSLDDPKTAYSAAVAVKTIVAGTEDEIDYETLKAALEKAMEIYAAAGGADDGYAVDEIKKMLSGLQPRAEKFVLPEDEAAAGYEVLFDGTDMSAWTGNLEGYTPVNGTIFVTAGYGNSKNLYTKKEYSDFVFKFEFCFVTPGVNNGVGIRTPMGKDAAYWGMCEVQILDHDDPIYKNLREYQVHGSAYGIIPARRVVHKPLGEWNTEEIRVVGDRVTVTLNGEVILDGNLRKACKGHNVAPDGSNKNPYTVDHKNHPGMFNEKGHIGFLGHGAGIKFRNVRVLDLSKN